MKNKILFLTKYDNAGASSRYRSLQYLPILKKAGLECEVSPLFSEQYLSYKYKYGSAPFKVILKSLILRLFAIFRALHFPVVVIEYELIPFFPPVFEWILNLRGCKLVIDYDDAIFHRYDKHRNSFVRKLFSNKIASVMRAADVVVVGNGYLADYAYEAKAKQVELIPTVLDLSRYHMSTPKQNKDLFTIGWIGSPTTAKYLHNIVPALAHICKNNGGTVTLIGAEDVGLSGVSVNRIPWSEDSEVENLLGFDVGVMPLPDEPWARGKCGFKIIQYMASGLPVIASPVGVNKDIVSNNNNGFLASSTEHWINALEVLRKDVELRRQMGKEGRKLVEKKYCIDVTGKKMVELFNNITKKKETL